MNIFILDENPVKCARYHCDKHVNKMLLEAAQMLCTVAWSYGNKVPYQPTHLQHPCTQWVATTSANWDWLIRLSFALNQEYKYRFFHTVNHKSYNVIQSLVKPKLPNQRRTPFVQVIPEQYRQSSDPVLAYRRFYVAEKGHFCQWTRRSIPFWFDLDA